MKGTDITHMFDQPGGEVEAYRPQGETGKTILGLASDVGLDDWVRVNSIRLSVMRYPGGKIGQGWFYKYDVGYTHISVQRFIWYDWKGKMGGYEFVPWFSVGYERKWKETKLIRFQGQVSVRYASVPSNVLFQWLIHFGRWTQ